MTEYTPESGLPAVPPQQAYAPPPPPPAAFAPHPAYSQPYASGHVMTDQTGQNAQAIVAWVLTVITFGYMLPWAIAASRGKSNAGAVGLLNLLLGWTFVGWIVALVMACGPHQVAFAPVTNSTVVIAQNFAGPAPMAPPVPQSPPPAGWYPDATGVQRYWDGARWFDPTAGGNAP